MIKKRQNQYKREPFSRFWQRSSRCRNPQVIANSRRQYKEDNTNIKTLILNELKQKFRPEFLNRIDDIVIFNPLEKDHIEKIVEIKLNKLKEKLQTKNLIVDFDKTLIEHLVEIGFDPIFGARPINRAIQNDVESFLSDKILEDQLIEGKNYHLSFKDDLLILN